MSYLHLPMPLKKSDMTRLGMKIFYVKTSTYFNKTSYVICSGDAVPLQDNVLIF